MKTQAGITCYCDWEDGCSGTGVLRCAGCGGDNCICTCGGETECPGCEYCEDSPEWDDDDVQRAVITAEEFT